MTSLLKYLKGYLPETIIAPLAKYVEAFIELVIPFLVEAMIDDGINPDGVTNSFLFNLLGIKVGTGFNLSVIIWLGVAMACLAAIGLGFSLVCQYLASRAAVGFGCNLRRALFSHILRMSPDRADGIGTAALVNRLSGDVTATQLGLAMFLRLMLRAPFLAAGAVIMCVLAAPSLWYVYLSSAAVSLAALFVIMRLSVPKFTDVQKKLDRISSLTGETVKGQRVIRAFARESDSRKRFEATTESQTKASVSASAVSCLLTPIVSVAVNIAIVLILWLGGIEIGNDELTAGTLVALINYMTQMLLALIALANFTIIISKALTGAKRINEVFAAPLFPEGEGATANTNDEIIRMENAGFSFGGDSYAVENLNFSLYAGEVLGVTGTTGSGKSTLASLATRLSLPTTGKVYLAGRDSRDYTDDQICRLVTLAPQKAALFSGTVRTNLAFGGDKTDSEMDEALQDCAAYKFVYGKNGLDTVVDQKGSSFSGGERQRLSIARAMLKNAPLLVVDDAASALDYITEDSVAQNLLARFRSSAVILISGRVGMLRHADRVLVLDGGKVMGLGTHEELLRSCELYKRLHAQA